MVPSSLSVAPMPPSTALPFSCQLRPTFTDNQKTLVGWAGLLQLGMGGGTTLSWRMSRDDLEPRVERIPAISTAM